MAGDLYDVMIVGTGPAGLRAALFAQRLGLRSVVLGDIPGGNLYMVVSLMNFPGFLGGVPGAQFGAVCFQQAAQEGAEFPMARLERLIHADEQILFRTPRPGRPSSHAEGEKGRLDVTQWDTQIAGAEPAATPKAPCGRPPMNSSPAIRQK